MEWDGDSAAVFHLGNHQGRVTHASGLERVEGRWRGLVCSRAVRWMDHATSDTVRYPIYCCFSFSIHRASSAVSVDIEMNDALFEVFTGDQSA